MRLEMILATLALLILAACASTVSAPVTAYAVVSPEQSPPPAWILFDGNVLVAKGAVGGEAGVLGKATGLPYLGPLVVSEGEVIIYRREPEERLTLGPGEPLPFWAAEAFAPGQAERLGVTFQEPELEPG